MIALQRAVTGAWLSTSVAEKSLWPNYGPVETLAVATQYGVDVLRGLLLGLYPPESAIGFARGEASFFFPPLSLVLVLWPWRGREARSSAPARLWLAVVALVFALTGPNVFMGVHFNRYLMWAFPGLLALAAAGLGALTRLAAREDAPFERDLFRAGAALALLLGALSTAHFAAVYAELAGETWRREIPMAAFIRAELPRGVAIANAATSVEYLTGHRNLNLHGVTSPGFAGGRTAEREAGMFESLSRIPAGERPPYLLLTRSGHEGSELMQALAPGPPLFATTSFGDDLLLFQASWDVLDGGEEPVLEPARDAVLGLERTDAARRLRPRRRGGARLPLRLAPRGGAGRRLRGDRPVRLRLGRAAARRRGTADPGRRVVPGPHAPGTRPGRGAAHALTGRGARDARERRHGDGGLRSRRPASWSRRAAARSRGSRCATPPAGTST